MNRKNRQFTQISLFSVLLGGHYDGIVSVGEIKKLGNLAIATMDRYTPPKSMSNFFGTSNMA